MLRSQLSNQEQALLFFNSLSDIGKPWGVDIKSVDLNNQLITKYNLVKNIPIGYTKNIEIKDYYPNVHYEGDTIKTETRIKLERNYS